MGVLAVDPNEGGLRALDGATLRAGAQEAFDPDIVDDYDDNSDDDNDDNNNDNHGGDEDGDDKRDENEEDDDYKNGEPLSKKQRM
jgi:hypothetical protein